MPRDYYSQGQGNWGRWLLPRGQHFPEVQRLPVWRPIKQKELVIEVGTGEFNRVVSNICGMTSTLSGEYNEGA